MALYFSGVCFEFVISLGSIYRRLLCHWATDSQCEPLCSHPDSLSGTWLCCLTGHYSFPSEVSVGLWARQLRGKLYSSSWQGICSRKAKHFNQVFTGWVPAFSWESGGLLWVRPWLVHYWRWVHSCLDKHSDGGHVSKVPPMWLSLPQEALSAGLGPSQYHVLRFTLLGEHHCFPEVPIECVYCVSCHPRSFPESTLGMAVLGAVKALSPAGERGPCRGMVPWREAFQGAWWLVFPRGRVLVYGMSHCRSYLVFIFTIIPNYLSAGGGLPPSSSPDSFGRDPLAWSGL